MKIIAAFLTLAISLLLTVSGAQSQELEKDDEGFFSTPDKTASAPMSAGQTLSVTIPSSVHGTLSIVADDVSEASLRYRKRAMTDNRRSAFDYIDVVTVSFEGSSDGVKLECRAPLTPEWKDDEYVSLELELTMPRATILRIDAAKVRSVIEGPVKGVAITGAEEDVEILDVTDWVNVSAQQSTVKMERIEGEIRLQVTGGTLVMEEATTSANPAQIESSGSDIRISTFKGALDLNAESGRIEITEFEPIGDKSSLRVNGAPLQVEISNMNSGRINLSNKGEDIELSVPGDIQATFSLTVDEGSTITATRLSMRPDLVLPQRLNLITGNGAAEIRASVRRSGNIYLRGYGDNE